MSDIKRAAGYVRVSTQEQVKHGWNLDEDRTLIAEMADAKGWELVEVYDDGGRQGDDPDRPGLLRMLGDLGGLDVVVVRTQERLSRDPVIWGTIEAACLAHRVQIVTTSGQVIDLDTPQGRFVAGMMAQIGKLEKGQTSQRVKQAAAARAKSGQRHMGARTYGYVWVEQKLVIEPTEAVVVVWIFRQYLNGVSQRQLARSLNERGGVTTKGKPWTQSRITRVLSNRTYLGEISFHKEWMPGKHEPIIDQATFDRVAAMRQVANQNRGGRQPDATHLLTHGVFRCVCGSAMVPRKARPGGGRDRYECSGRIAHGPSFCTQPSLRREVVDEPFLENLLEYYINLDATKRRLSEQTTMDLQIAREAQHAAEAEVSRARARLSKIKRGWQDAVIDDAEYADQKVELEDELTGAETAHQRASDHIARLEAHGPLTDAEEYLLAYLTEVRDAIRGRVEAAPDLNSLRRVIFQLFERIDLIPFCGNEFEGIPAVEFPLPKMADGTALYPWFRDSAVDAGTLTPIGQEMPVPPSPQYPSGFLSRYCWW